MSAVSSDSLSRTVDEAVVGRYLDQVDAKISEIAEEHRELAEWQLLNNDGGRTNGKSRTRTELSYKHQATGFTLEVRIRSRMDLALRQVSPPMGNIVDHAALGGGCLTASVFPRRSNLAEAITAIIRGLLPPTRGPEFKRPLKEPPRHALDSPRSVDSCELLIHPARYHGQIVRVKGTYRSDTSGGSEYAALYPLDRSCRWPQPPRPIRIYFSERLKGSHSLQRLTYQHLPVEAHVVFVGEVQGEEGVRYDDAGSDEAHMIVFALELVGLNVHER